MDHAAALQLAQVGITFRPPLEIASAHLRGSYSSILMMCDQLILFSVNREFRKLFFVIRGFRLTCEELEKVPDIHDFDAYQMSIL